jgi:hypothetical protein
MALYEDLDDHCSILQRATFQEVTVRLLFILEWMESQPEIKIILNDLRNDERVNVIMAKCGHRHPPQAANRRDVAGVGLSLLDTCRQLHSQGVDLGNIAIGRGISGYNRELDTCSDEAMQRYVSPFFEYVLKQLPRDSIPAYDQLAPLGAIEPFIPVAIQDSLAEFRKDHLNAKSTCFVMMQFTETPAHLAIEKAIKDTLSKYHFTGLLARDKEYNDNLYPNIQTYMHGCEFGIAVFERIQKDDFNPNVSLEVGYMLGLKKRVLLLKDKTLTVLHADLAGKLYRPFDVQNSKTTIPPEIERWMEDKALI